MSSSTISAAGSERGPAGVIQETDAFSRGKFLPGLGRSSELDRAAFTASVGELGPVVLTTKGAVVFRVTSRESVSGEDFQRDKEELRRVVRREKARRLYEWWMEKLKETTEIKILAKS